MAWRGINGGVMANGAMSMAGVILMQPGAMANIAQWRVSVILMT